MLNGPAQRLGFLVNLAATAGASASRVFEIIDIPSETIEHPAAHPLDAVHGEVTLAPARNLQSQPGNADKKSGAGQRPAPPGKLS